MKLAIIAGMLMAVGCSTAPETSATLNDSIDQDIPAWGTSEIVTLSKDHRPVDGDNVVVTFSLDAEGTYTADLLVQHGGFRTGEPLEDIEETLATGLTCRNGFADEIGTLTNMSCFRDHGEQGSVGIEATISNYGSGYDVKFHQSYGIGDAEPTIRDLGYNLELAISGGSVTNLELPTNGDCSNANGTVSYSAFSYMGGAAPMPGMVVKSAKFVVDGSTWGEKRIHQRGGFNTEDLNDWDIEFELSDVTVLESNGDRMAGNRTYTGLLKATHMLLDVAPVSQRVICQSSWIYLAP